MAATVAAVIGLGIFGLMQSQARVITPDVIRALGSGDAEAAAVLGVPVPRPTFLPLGLTRSAITLDEKDNSVGLTQSDRKVRQSFAIGGRYVALLTVFRATLGTSLDKTTTVQLGKFQAQLFTKTLADGSENLSYRWQQGTLAMFMDINLVSGLTREIADRIVASVN